MSKHSSISTDEDAIVLMSPTHGQRRATHSHTEHAACAPEGVVAFTPFARELGMAAATLHSWIKTHSDLVGEIGKFWFHSKNGLGLTPEQQKVIRENIKRPGNTPAGILSVRRFAKELDVCPSALRAWLKSHAELIGKVKRYRFRSKKGLGLTPKQQRITRERMDVPDRPPKGTVSVRQFAFNELHICDNTLRSWLRGNPDIIGEVKKYRFPGQYGLGLSPEQQRITRERMDYVANTSADVFSIDRAAVELNVSEYILRSWLKAHSDLIGEIKEYRFYNSHGLGLTPTQQRVLLLHQDEIGGWKQRKRRKS